MNTCDITLLAFTCFSKDVLTLKESFNLYMPENTRKILIDNTVGVYYNVNGSPTKFTIIDENVRVVMRPCHLILHYEDSCKNEIMKLKLYQ